MLNEDLVAVQFHKSTPFGVGRSATFWIPVGQANQFQTIDDLRRSMALPPEWGERNVVSVARIPKGTDVTYYSGRTAPQQSRTGEIFPGEGEQMLFQDFDPRWVVETRPIPE